MKYIIGRSFYTVLQFAALVQDQDGNIDLIHSDDIDSANLQVVLTPIAELQSDDNTISAAFSTKRYSFTAEGTSFNWIRGGSMDQGVEILESRAKILKNTPRLLEDKDENK